MGQQFQHIKHNRRAPSFNQEKEENQITSQSRIIIPRGIINFKKGKSVSVDKYINNNGTEISKQDEESDNHPESIYNTMLIGQGSTFMEPRDESLMRKKKVIEILKTFQQDDVDNAANEKKNSFGEQFERIDEKKKSFNGPLNIDPIQKNNNTYY